jgi:plastocyanin
VQFSVATPGTYYFRAYALFNGSSVWSDERTITITQAQAGPPVNQSAPQTYDVTIQNFAFSPANLSIKAGDTVRWTNRDSTAYHTVTSDSGGSELISDVLGDGASFSHKFTTAGTFPYHCSIHTSMKGTITVV